MCLTMTEWWQCGGHFPRTVELVCGCAVQQFDLTLGKDCHSQIFVWMPLPGAVLDWNFYFWHSLLQWPGAILRFPGEGKGWRFENTPTSGISSEENYAVKKDYTSGWWHNFFVAEGEERVTVKISKQAECVLKIEHTFPPQHARTWN